MFSLHAPSLPHHGLDSRRETKFIYVWRRGLFERGEDFLCPLVIASVVWRIPSVTRTHSRWMKAQPEPHSVVLQSVHTNTARFCCHRDGFCRLIEGKSSCFPHVETKVLVFFACYTGEERMVTRTRGHPCLPSFFFLEERAVIRENCRTLLLFSLFPSERCRAKPARFSSRGGGAN